MRWKHVCMEMLHLRLCNLANNSLLIKRFKSIASSRKLSVPQKLSPFPFFQYLIRPEGFIVGHLGVSFYVKTEVVIFLAERLCKLYFIQYAEDAGPPVKVVRVVIKAGTGSNLQKSFIIHASIKRQLKNE